MRYIPTKISSKCSFPFFSFNAFYVFKYLMNMLMISKVYIDAHHLDINCRRNKWRDRLIRPLENYASYVRSPRRVYWLFSECDRDYYANRRATGRRRGARGVRVIAHSISLVINSSHSRLRIAAHYRSLRNSFGASFMLAWRLRIFNIPDTYRSFTPLFITVSTRRASYSLPRAIPLQQTSEVPSSKRLGLSAN